MAHGNGLPDIHPVPDFDHSACKYTPANGNSIARANCFSDTGSHTNAGADRHSLSNGYTNPNTYGAAHTEATTGARVDLEH